MWVEVLDPCEGQARRSVGSCSPKCRLLASECPLPGVGWKDQLTASRSGSCGMGWLLLPPKQVTKPHTLIFKSHMASLTPSNNSTMVKFARTGFCFSWKKRSGNNGNNEKRKKMLDQESQGRPQSNQKKEEFLSSFSILTQTQWADFPMEIRMIQRVTGVFYSMIPQNKLSMRVALRRLDIS